MTTGVLSAMAGSQSEFTAGELLGITNPSACVVGKKLSRVPNCSPKPRVENREIQPARQAVEHGLHVRQRVMDLLHVAPDHHVRQAAGAAERVDVILRRLRVALVAQRQRAVRETVRPPCADNSINGVDAEAVSTPPRWRRSSADPCGRCRR